MKINCISTFIFLLAGLNESFSQVTFQKYYYAGVSSISNIAYSVVECADSGFIFFGGASINHGDLYISKTNSSGNLIWSMVFRVATGNNEDPIKVLETHDGGYAFLGMTGVNMSFTPDILLGKFDANGNRMWVKKFGDTLSDYAYDFKQTSDSGFIILGNAMIGGSYGTILIKTNANGDTLWTKKYYFWASNLCPTPDGGYFIGGGGGLLVKIDSYGVVQWSRTSSFSNHTISLNSIESAEDSTYILTYSCYWLPSPTYPIYYSALMKVNSLGDTLWTRRFNNKVMSCKPNLNTGIIGVVADSISFYLDKNGNIIGSYSFQGLLRNINSTHDNGFIICGQTLGSAYSYLIKTDSLGNNACGSTTINVPLQYFPIIYSSDTINTSWGGLPFIDISVDSTYQMHEHTICTSIGIDENKDANILSVFPNPASSKLFINWENRIGRVQVSLYNIIGKLCYKKDVFNSSTSEIDVSTFEKGIYLLRIDSHEQSFWSKVVVE